ncbi:MAG: FAD-dependent thymidylate synthase [Bacillota bacterium]
MRIRVIYYPFMGTSINTERLLLMTRLCYAPLGVDELAGMVQGESGPDDEATGRFVRGLIASGHLGALEHWHTSFAVEGYSRISSQQNDRHRLMKMLKEPGVYINAPQEASPDISQLQQSQRYVKEDDFHYIVPPTFQKHPEYLERFHRLQAEIRSLQVAGLDLGIPAEDVRFALSNATETRFVITTNARQLRHMFNLRCCERAQWEIRDLFRELLATYKKIAPNIFCRAGASCEERGYCPEGKMCCGRAPTLEEFQKAWKQRRREV